METLTRRLGLFFASKRNRQFRWGRDDCSTLVLEAHDFLHNSNHLSKIFDKYNDMRGAYRLAKTMDALEVLKDIGYKPAKRPVDGDILAVKWQHGYYLHVVLNGAAYSYHPQIPQGICRVSVDCMHNYTVWRYRA